MPDRDGISGSLQRGRNHGFQDPLRGYSCHRTGPGKFLSLVQVFAYPQPSFVPAESSEVRSAERSAAGAKEIATGVIRASSPLTVSGGSGGGIPPAHDGKRCLVATTAST